MAGPKRILTALNDYTFEVQDLVAPFTISTSHASRLQLYRDAARGHVEDLTEQAVHGEGGHLVEGMVECRLGLTAQRWETLVKRYGLDDMESSWEPADTIQEDSRCCLRRSSTPTPTIKTDAAWPRRCADPQETRRQSQQEIVVAGGKWKIGCAGGKQSFRARGK